MHSENIMTSANSFVPTDKSLTAPCRFTVIIFKTNAPNKSFLNYIRSVCYLFTVFLFFDEAENFKFLGAEEISDVSNGY